MNYKAALAALSIIFLSGSCKTETKQMAKEEPTTSAPRQEKQEGSKADQVVAHAIERHGGKKYGQAHYGFTFRKKKYTFRNNGRNYTYTAEENKNGQNIIDTLQNGNFKRYVNNGRVQLNEKDVFKYTEALNSVIYFATLPHKLNDRAVKKEYLGNTEIKGEPYEIVQVSFEQQGGGVDFEDVFLYWFHAENKTMDYLAYEYHTNDGGIRFRSSYNPRTVDGVLFQDYINYKAPLGTDLKDLPSLFQMGKLEELSRIETEDVVNLNS